MEALARPGGAGGIKTAAQDGTPSEGCWSSPSKLHRRSVARSIRFLVPTGLRQPSTPRGGKPQFHFFRLLSHFVHMAHEIWRKLALIVQPGELRSLCEPIAFYLLLWGCVLWEGAVLPFDRLIVQWVEFSFMAVTKTSENNAGQLGACRHPHSGRRLTGDGQPRHAIDTTVTPSTVHHLYGRDNRMRRSASRDFPNRVVEIKLIVTAI